MKIPYRDTMVGVGFNEMFSMFSLDGDFEVEAYCCDRSIRSEPNQCWLLKEFLSLFVDNKIVSPVMHDGAMVLVYSDESEVEEAVLCDIIHPEFNDHGYSLFGDYCRSRLGQQCQYGSRYITGRIEGYPALGEGLRFLNTDSGNYHAIRIHRDDMDEFERRYKEYFSR